MPHKPTLYIDVDDTIIAQVLAGSGFDLRPCVVTHLTVLGSLFDCCWLTTWPYGPGADESSMSIWILMRAVYGHRINQSFRYAEWDRDHPMGKAGFVLSLDQPQNWYWLEDSISKGEEEALSAAGLLERYIPVEPTGPWGFLAAVNELFHRAGITRNHLLTVQARPEWFDPLSIVSSPC